MLFSSPVFLFVFLPVLMGLHVVCPLRFRNPLLLVGSLVFYYWGSGYLLALLMVSILGNYVFGLVLGRLAGRRRQAVLAAAVAANLGLLFYYKYVNFAVAQLGRLFAALELPDLEPTNIALPIGISFFTFQALSYVIDVARGRTRPQRSLVDFAMYIALFPQLIAGPIVRYVHIAAQLRDRRVSADMFFSGLRRFFFGLAKKLVIADQLGRVADAIVGLPAGELGAAPAWLGMVCFALQIYYDFSGYSDMAIGLGRMLGFRFLENFDYPYISRSIREFWRRWHISLSTWLRDYLYIPLGGSRFGAWRTYANLWTVFVLCGLWHGASWNFLIWGCYHGLFLALERGALGRWLEALPRPLRHLYALLVLVVGWVFFRIEDFGHALGYLRVMFLGGPAGLGDLAFHLDAEVALYLALAVVFSTPVVRTLGERVLHRRPVSAELAGMGAAVLAACLAVLLMASSSYKPFIYFKF